MLKTKKEDAGMEIITIQQSQFCRQKTYIDDANPDDNFADEDVINVQNLLLPSPNLMHGWIYFDLTPLQGKKRIVSAVLHLDSTALIGSEFTLRLTEPIGPLIPEDQLTWNNKPASKSLKVKDSFSDAGNPAFDFDITQIITDMVEGRRENKGFYLQLVPPTPDEDLGIGIIAPRVLDDTSPSLTVILDPTLQGNVIPHHRRAH
jgi:hypothetical protein